MQYRFGSFLFDSVTGDLDGRGRSVRLTDKQTQFLEALVEADRGVVKRDDLRKQIWGEDVHVDFDANINIIAHKVREALEDSADDPRILETIPRRGYRLLVPASRIEAGESRGTGSFVRWVLAASVVGVAIALLAFAAANRDRSVEPVSEPPRALLVLPFEDRGGSAQFASGITEAVISRLGRIDPSRLSVYAPRTAEAYRNLAEGSGAMPLRPDFIVEGTVVTSGDLSHVAVRLIEPPEMRVVWTRQGEFTKEDLLGAQSQIAGWIVRAAVPRVTYDPESPRLREGTENPAAFYELTVARQFWNEFEPRSFHQSLGHFERAVALDPAYAEGWAGVADAWNMLALFGEVDRENGFDQAEKAARTALELDDRNAAAHAALAMTLFHGRLRFDDALAHYERSVEIVPARALTHQWMAGLYTAMGKPDQAVEAARKAARLDPLSLAVSSDLGWYLYYARRFREAVDQGERTLAIYPDSEPTLFMVELSQRALGRDGEAMETMARRLRADHVPEDLVATVQTAFREQGSREASRRWAELLEGTAETPKRLYGIAVYRALAGDADRARSALEQAKRDRVSWLPYVQADPVLGTLEGVERSDAVSSSSIPGGEPAPS